MVAAALARVRAPVARVTTLGLFLDDEMHDLPLNYGGFLALMRACLDRGGKYAAVEMTSEALALGFARSWPCQIAVFTNLTRDHLDSHGTSEHYLASKAQLFMQLPQDGAAILNGCDPAAALLAEVIPPGVRTFWYGAPSRGDPLKPLDLAATQVEPTWNGTLIQVEAPGLDVPRAFSIRAIGEVFGENALAALAASLTAGVSAAEATDAIATFEPPSGRFEVVGHRPYVVVDFAHTPDALARTLATARSLSKGKLTVVFGAGGNRDREKRPMMGAAAAIADRVILTSDNPRDEDPSDISAALALGLGGHRAVETILDREAAIFAAIRNAYEEDVTVIAGRGHETEQWVAGRRIPFSDRDVARRALAERWCSSMSQ